MHLGATGGWTDDWLWGLSLIATTTVMHVLGMFLIAMLLSKIFVGAVQCGTISPLPVFTVTIGVAALLLALLHGCEVGLWAATLVGLGAVADFRSAIYFSMQMATTLGADVVQLESPWKLMGPLEGISGMLVFGLSTAFLFAITQRVWPFAETRASERRESMSTRPPTR